jgi:hypothetical protein
LEAHGVSGTRERLTMSCYVSDSVDSAI